MHGPRLTPLIELVVAKAELQHGVISREQLHDLGCGRGWIEGRVRSGHLRVLLPGVYAVGQTALRREGRWLAAVLWAGDGSVLSHQSAGALLACARTTRSTSTSRRRARPVGRGRGSGSTARGR